MKRLLFAVAGPSVKTLTLLTLQNAWLSQRITALRLCIDPHCWSINRSRASHFDLPALPEGKATRFTGGRLLCIGAVTLLMILSGHLAIAVAGESTVHALETHHTQVLFQTEADILTFDRKISIELSVSGLSKLSVLQNVADSATRLKIKLDGLFERVQEVLDMRKAMDKVRINVYSDKNGLQAAYNRFQSGKCRIRAWYVFEENSVYVSAADVNAGMLGHELAHAIIDHFFQVRPPKATAEILARYVDRHVD